MGLTWGFDRGISLVWPQVLPCRVFSRRFFAPGIRRLGFFLLGGYSPKWVWGLFFRPGFLEIVPTRFWGWAFFYVSHLRGNFRGPFSPPCGGGWFLPPQRVFPPGLEPRACCICGQAPWGFSHLPGLGGL